jgi:NAD(P)-dependent dehydrogenase (short-subunit alcohol dehydrogenase family)
MKIIVVGASGTIGKPVADALEVRHEVVRASRNGPEVKVDITDPDSIKAMYEQIGTVDALVSVAGSVAFKPIRRLRDEDFAFSLGSKLMGQVNLVRFGVNFVSGSFTLTGGVLAHAPLPKASAASLVNAGLEGFIRGAALELAPVRVNLVSPPWVRETLVTMGKDPLPGLPAADVAKAYVEAVENAKLTGQVLEASSFG